MKNSGQLKLLPHTDIFDSISVHTFKIALLFFMYPAVKKMCHSKRAYDKTFLNPIFVVSPFFKGILLKETMETVAGSVHTNPVLNCSLSNV